MSSSTFTFSKRLASHGLIATDPYLSSAGFIERESWWSVGPLRPRSGEGQASAASNQGLRKHNKTSVKLSSHEAAAAEVTVQVGGARESLPRLRNIFRDDRTSNSEYVLHIFQNLTHNYLYDNLTYN